MKIRWVAAAAACVLTIGAPSALASPRTGTGRVTLTGTVVLAGSHSGGIAVRLPKPAKMTVGDFALISPPDARVAGKGRFSGFVLHRDGAWDQPTVFTLQARACTSPGCTDPYEPLFYSALFLGPRQTGSGTLPPGDYHLYLVADASPTTVTLRLHGLTGRRTLDPPRMAGTSIVDVQPDLQVNPPGVGPMVYSGGVTHEFPHRGGLDISLLWYLLPLPDEEVLLGDCHYQGPPPDPVLSYESPLCSGSRYVTNLSGPVGPHSGPFGVFGQYGGSSLCGGIRSPGTWSDGQYLDAFGPVDSVHLTTLVVNF